MAEKTKVLPDHSPYGPSSAKRWTTCTASVGEIKKLAIREKKSDYADEGTLAHELARLALEGHSGLFPKLKCADNEMIKHANHFRQYVFERVMDAFIFCEDRVYYDHIIPEGFGTVDAWSTCKTWEGRVHIFDYKYGKGIPVHAKMNPQLLTYALGVKRKVKERWGWIPSSYELHIFQPRINNISNWVIGKDECVSVLDDWKHVLQDSYDESINDPVYYPTEDNCRFCAAVPTCPGVEHYLKRTLGALKNLETIEYSKDDYEILRNKNLILKYLNKAEDYVLSMLEMGVQVPGFGITEAQTRRRVSEEGERKLNDIYGDQIYKPNALKPLRELASLVTSDEFADCTEKPKGSNKLFIYEEE